jgi:hypothetical protein
VPSTLRASPSGVKWRRSLTVKGFFSSVMTRARAVATTRWRGGS